MLVRLLLALSFVVAPIASQVHDLVVSHGICDEHGETVEGAVAHAVDAGISADSEAHHEHGCGFPAVPAPAPHASADAPAPPHARNPTPTLPAADAIPRTSPLSFAPKTSPPRS